MDRDEFMELVYETFETFADEPDNVLANGIIEAADAYVEHEKAKLFSEGTTSDLISRQNALDIFDDYNVSVENGELEAYSRDRKRMCNLPTIQPEPRTGKWTLGFDNRYMEKYYYCSRCGGRKYGEHEPLDYFCSNCGADMRGGQDGH
jgi:hypothetical protein